MKVIKKDGTLEAFDGQKIVNAVTKSASRVMVTLTDKQFDDIVAAVVRMIEDKGLEEIPVGEMHNIMEQVLEDFNPKVAKSYKDYRNYKKDFVHLMDEVYIKSQSIRFIGDKENANTDSALVATKSGGRNLSLTSLAGAMHNTGYSKQEIYKELCYVNQRACKPPLPDRELRTICESVTRYRR